MNESPLTRRQALAAILPGNLWSRPRLAPLDEIVLVGEFEENAKLKLSASVMATLASGGREALDRITLRPRLLIPTMDLDLGLELFGSKLFAPILVGPIPNQRRYHPEGELATAQGAAAGNALMVVSSHSSVPIDEIASKAGTPLWYQADLSAGGPERARRAVKAGSQAVCLSPKDWAASEALRRELGVPALARGVLTPEGAENAVQKGAQGIIVSDSGKPGRAAPIEFLPSIVDAVGGRVPVLIEGDFQLGVDIFKALALGAKAVILGPAPLRGLAAYGPEGVRTVLELLQRELGRAMGMCGNPNLASLDRSRVRIHT